jgi:hypothetical protein
MLGKILAFLNILGVAGLLYLATVTYAKRQQWEYANFRADLIPFGLPINDKKVEENGDTEKDGTLRLNKFERFGDPSTIQNDGTFKALFPSDRPKLPTQVSEVERVYGKLKAQLDAPENDVRKKDMFLARIVQGLTGSHQRPDIYTDREFYLSMESQLKDDESYEAFRKALADAIPIAVEKTRFDTKKLSFEKAFQDALLEQPGEDRWKLAEAFLRQLPLEGVTFEQAGEAAKNASLAVEAKVKARQKTEEDYDTAKSAAFVAAAEFKADPNDKAKEMARDKLAMERQTAEKKALEAVKPFEVAAAKAQARAVAENAMKNAKTPEEIAAAKKALAEAVAADEAARRETDPRTAAAVVFLQTLRKDDKKTRVIEFVEDVMEKTLEDVQKDLNSRFETAYREAHEGVSKPGETEADLKLIHLRQRQAIARFLLAALEALDDKDPAKSEVEALQKDEKPEAMVDLASFKRFITVVGVDMAIWAMNNQAQALADAAADVQDRINHERSDFRDRHLRALIDLSKRADGVARLDDRRKDIVEQALAQEGVAKGEKERVEGYRNDLNASREKTAEAMKNLVKLTDGLDTVRKDIRNAIRDNENHLRRIAALEAEVLSLQLEVAAKEKAEKDRKKRKTMP